MFLFLGLGLSLCEACMLIPVLLLSLFVPNLHSVFRFFGVYFDDAEMVSLWFSSVCLPLDSR